MNINYVHMLSKELSQFYTRMCVRNGDLSTKLLIHRGKARIRDKGGNLSQKEKLYVYLFDLDTESKIRI